MKDKICKISLLFLLFLVLFCLIINYKKPLTCKILDVIEADEFYLDFNNNNKIDNNEHVKLKNVISFKQYKTSYYDKKFAQYNLNYEEYTKAGYIAYTWACDNLKNQYVEVKKTKLCKKNEICKVDIKFNNKDLATTLVNKGLAYPEDKPENKELIQYSDIRKTKKLIEKISSLDFVFLNLKTNIVHSLKCEHLDKLSNAKLLLRKDADKNLFCKKCLNLTPETINFTYNIPKSKKIYKKSISKNFLDIDLYLINPLEYSKPSTTCRSEFNKRLLREINLAENSIDIALYGFGEQKEIFNALKSAKQRGVKIRAVSECDKNSKSHYSHTKDFINEFSATCDNKPSLMHNKFFIIDKKLLMTGTANISTTGSAGYNANLALFVKDKPTINKYLKEFEQMHSGKFSHSKTSNATYDNLDIQAYFSPQDNIYIKAIRPQILNAKEKIYVSAFYLTENEFIKDLILAKRKGIEVLILVDATSANNFKNKISQIRNEKIPLIVENWGGKNHEKTIAIDGKVLITGSSNFSKSGFYKNDENILIINNPEIAEFYQDYFLYLFNSIDKIFLSKIPRAESFDSKNSCFDGIDNNFDGKTDSEDEACKK